jgi:hypothetical protein
MQQQFYVYELIDPRTNIPFYVGKGCGNRIHQHILEANKPRDKQVNKFKCAVINNILSNHRVVVESIIQDKLSEQQAFELEIELIAKYGKRWDGTGSLTNFHDGGIGGTGYPKEIEQYSITGSFIKSHSSITLAAMEHNIHKSSICAALNGRTLLAGGYRWGYVGDILTPYTNMKYTPVSCYNMDGTIRCSFNSIKSAAKSCNIIYTNIIDAIAGRHHTAGGYRWAYLGEIPNSIPDGYNIPGTRKFACYDNNMQLIKVYDNLADAVLETGAVSSGIVDRCAGRVKYKSGGFYWKYYS